MERDRVSGGVFNIIGGLTFCAIPLIVDKFIIDMIVSDTTEDVGVVIKASFEIIESMGTIIKIIGFTMILKGMVRLATGMLYGPLEFASLDYYDSSTKTLRFWIIGKREFENIDVKLANLSDSTIEILRTKIETPLKELYEAASKGKRAKAEYRNCSVYIESVADDLNKAISQCENELMEEKLIDKLYIVENSIINIKDRINAAITADKDEERYLKELQLESYEPFTLTDNMNKLI